MPGIVHFSRIIHLTNPASIDSAICLFGWPSFAGVGQLKGHHKNDAGRSKPFYQPLVATLKTHNS